MLKLGAAALSVLAIAIIGCTRDDPKPQHTVVDIVKAVRDLERRDSRCESTPSWSSAKQKWIFRCTVIGYPDQNFCQLVDDVTLEISTVQQTNDLC